MYKALIFVAFLKKVYCLMLTTTIVALKMLQPRGACAFQNVLEVPFPSTQSILTCKQKKAPRLVLKGEWQKFFMNV